MSVTAFLLVVNVLVVSLMTMVTVSQAASPGDIVINEIMKDPAAVLDTNGEWFELYNTTGSDININGWVIKDNDTDSHTIDSANGPTIVPAGGYLVLARNKDAGTNGGVSGAYEYSGFILANTIDEVVLKEGATEIDRVDYDNTFPHAAGKSMELKNPSYETITVRIGQTQPARMETAIMVPLVLKIASMSPPPSPSLPSPPAQSLPKPPPSPGNGWRWRVRWG